MDPTEAEAAALFEQDLGAEASRARAHAREAARHRGVCWSACAPEPLMTRPRHAVMSQARRTAMARRAWRATEAGLFLNAVSEAQLIAGAAHQLCERARAAWSRNFAAEQDACAAMARQLEDHALRLLQTARLAQGAAPSALPPEGEADARNGIPPDVRG